MIFDTIDRQARDFTARIKNHIHRVGGREHAHLHTLAAHWRNDDEEESVAAYDEAQREVFRRAYRSARMVRPSGGLDFHIEDFTQHDLLKSVLVTRAAALVEPTFIVSPYIHMFLKMVMAYDLVGHAPHDQPIVGKVGGKPVVVDPEASDDAGIIIAGQGWVTFPDNAAFDVGHSEVGRDGFMHFHLASTFVPSIHPECIRILDVRPKK